MQAIDLLVSFTSLVKPQMESTGKRKGSRNNREIKQALCLGNLAYGWVQMRQSKTDQTVKEI